MDDNLRVVIAAAGVGRRMGGGINKPYRLLLSRPVLAYSIDVFEAHPQVDEIIVVAHPDEVDYCQSEVIKPYGYKKVSRVIPGGAERQDSVWAGLQSLGPDTAYVAVHDGARPLLSKGLIDRSTGSAFTPDYLDLPCSTSIGYRFIDFPGIHCPGHNGAEICFSPPGRTGEKKRQRL